MLLSLYIKNYAIIDEAFLEFDGKLNVLTGETGAGKSIILGALSLILGARMDSSALINKEEKCIIEATFKVADRPLLQQLFLKNDLDFEKETIIRREINTNNKSRAFINDTPVTLAVLQSITEHLVDLHAQFDTGNLKNQEFVYEIIDAFGGNQEVLNQYQSVFKQRQDLKKKIEEIETNLLQAQQELDYHQFLFNELGEVQLKEEEEEEIEQQLKQLENREEIATLHEYTIAFLDNEEYGILTSLKKALEQIHKLAQLKEDKNELYERLNSAYIEIEDISAEINNSQQTEDIDPQQVEQLQERQSSLFHLFKKHQVNSSKELIEIYNDLATKINQSEFLSEDLEHLKSEWDVLNIESQKLAEDLSKARKSSIKKFEPEVNGLITLIGMPNAQLKIAKEERKQLNYLGKDDMQILWDANKNGHFNALDKVASGGELSRIMLCIKSLTAKAIQLPTLIFDEVDTGISGESARQVSLLMESLSKEHQIVCITHLSQVASKGEHHFYVYKEEENGKVHTKIKVLNREERIEHIASMIGGGAVNDDIRAFVAEQIK